METLRVLVVDDEPGMRSGVELCGTLHSSVDSFFPALLIRTE